MVIGVVVYFIGYTLLYYWMRWITRKVYDSWTWRDVRTVAPLALLSWIGIFGLLIMDAMVRLSEWFDERKKAGKCTSKPPKWL